MKVYLVHFRDIETPSLIFSQDIGSVGERNRGAWKIEEIACWIVPGQGGKLP